MRNAVILLLLGASQFRAQTAPGPGVVFPALFDPQLKQYLGLSDEQIAGITSLKTQLASFLAANAQRQVQIQLEIEQETAKQSPDPVALGARYVEAESFRRQLQARQKTTADQTQALLKPDQKAKLAVLQQALALQSTACSALAQNLISPIGNTVPNSRLEPFPLLSSRWFDTYSFATLLSGIATSGVCGGAGAFAFRSGGFTGSLP